MNQRCLVALALALAGAGCTVHAEPFFSGRPSGMAQLHNRVIAGGPAAVKELLLVPARFPHAAGAEIQRWQYSVVAWWAVPEKRQWMLALFPQLAPAQRQSLRQWLQTRGTDLPTRHLQALDEMLQGLSRP